MVCDVVYCDVGSSGRARILRGKEGGGGQKRTALQKPGVSEYPSAHSDDTKRIMPITLNYLPRVRYFAVAFEVRRVSFYTNAPPYTSRCLHLRAVGNRRS